VISGSNFEWDPAKAAINLRNHRVAFEDAISVFYDDWAVIEDDPDPDEVRFRISGTTARGMLLVVVYTGRGNDTIRLISARKAKTHEARTFGQG
jgi:uncharacterized DUF497 family protein